MATLDKRIYSEHSDTEMDIWIKITVSHQSGTLSIQYEKIWSTKKKILS